MRLIQAKRITTEGRITGIQRRLAVGAADNMYEREIDHIARQIVDMPDSAIAESYRQRPPREEGQTQTPHAQPPPSLQDAKFSGPLPLPQRQAMPAISALNTDEAGLGDLVKFGKGNLFSLVELEDEISQLSLSKHYRFKVPIFFLLRRHDRHVSAILAEQYFETVEAPDKRLIWFEQSAHKPPFEEPEKFNKVLIEEVLPISRIRNQ